MAGADGVRKSYKRGGRSHQEVAWTSSMKEFQLCHSKREVLLMMFKQSHKITFAEYFVFKIERYVGPEWWAQVVVGRPVRRLSQ